MVIVVITIITVLLCSRSLRLCCLLHFVVDSQRLVCIRAPMDYASLFGVANELKYLTEI